MVSKQYKKIVILSVIMMVCFVIYLSGKHVLDAKNGFFYPTILYSALPVSGDLESTLIGLESILKVKNERAYSALNKGLSADAISRLERKYNIKLSKEIASLYMWHNGCGESNKDFSNGQIIPGHWFVPLEYALETRYNSDQFTGAFFQKVFYELFASYRKSWIVLLDDGFGDGYFYDPARSVDSVNVFYHSTEGGSYIFFPSLNNMLQAFTDCYHEEVYKVDRIMEIEDFIAEQKIMSKYGHYVN